MPDDKPLPDYYAILQVNPAAEPEIIDAAYRRLMLKNHPDTVAPELRSDPELLSKVRAINLAYDVLNNPDQRRAYDALFFGPQPDPAQELNPDIETRILLVACGNTKRKYRIRWVRQRQSTAASLPTR